MRQSRASAANISETRWILTRRKAVVSKSERKSDRRSRKTGSVCKTRWVLRGRNFKVSEGEKEKWQAKDASEVEVFRKE